MKTIDEETGEEPVRVICLRCGHDNSEAEALCASCKGPLGSFASSAPWEMGAAGPAAYPPATHPRTKPIVFWGVWLYFGPSAIGGLWTAGSFANDMRSSSPSEALNGTLFVLFGVLYTLVCFWVLWTVTRRYLSKPELPIPPDR